MSLSPAFFATRSDSPVSRLSFALHLPETTSQSDGTWSPRPSSTTSSRTISPSGMSCSSPSRMTCAFVDVITLKRSMVSLLRTSWKMPMTTLQRIIARKTRLRYEPVQKIATAKMTLTRLNSVQMLSRKMRGMERVLMSAFSLTLPSETRWATSALVRPRISAVVCAAVLCVAAACLLMMLHDSRKGACGVGSRWSFGLFHIRGT